MLPKISKIIVLVAILRNKIIINMSESFKEEEIVAKECPDDTKDQIESDLMAKQIEKEADLMAEESIERTN